MLEQAQRYSDELIAIRRHLHKYPELGYKEYNTTAYIQNRLADYGIVPKDFGLSTGLVADIDSGVEGPTVVLRADIDALPIAELTGLEYSSQIQGVMHACGHDSHTACLLGAARLLVEHKQLFCGKVRLLFQPAEEMTGGAASVVEKGVLQGTAAIFGLHNCPELPAGQLGLTAGPLMAAMDRMKITIIGRSGHGAQPQTAHDPIVAAAAIIQALQTIVARNVSPLEAAVVSCCSIHGGNLYNIIPEKVEIIGTVRTFSESVRTLVYERMSAMAESIAVGFDTQAELEYKHDLPAVAATAGMADFCLPTAKKIFGCDNIVEPVPSMGGEDFAVYLQQLPGMFFFLGSGQQAAGCNKTWHNARFNIDESCLAYGAAFLAQLAIDYLNGWQQGGR